VQLTGFGLHLLLDLHSTAQRTYLPAHLFTANGKFLGSPTSISPERVLDMPTDARSDVYVLGVLVLNS
jgi:serine/threonine protein kinase